ncbi:MAG: complex I NDUFA9 subunit family protein [Pseudomonadota bacterium]
MMRNILVLGGTGFVGRSVCEALVGRSGAGAGRILVPSRRPARAAHLRVLPTLELIRANLHDDQELLRLVQQADVVINLVAILHGNARSFEQVHVGLPQRLAAACAQAGVRRVIHVSALGVSEPPEQAPSNYLRSKGAGEAVLRAAALDLTVLRPSVIFGEHDRFVNLFAKLQGMLPVMALAGGQARFQPVWVEDVAQAVVHSLDHRATIGQTLECAGPEVVTLAEIVRRAGAWSGQPRPLLPLPRWVGTLQALTFELLPGEPLMSRDNLASMQVPNVATGQHPGLAAWDIAPTAMHSVMEPLLSQRQGPARLDALRKARSSRS